MERLGTKLIWEAEHKFTVNPNETRLRMIFRLGKDAHQT